MRAFSTVSQTILSCLLTGWLMLVPVAADSPQSAAGAIAIPQPTKPANAVACVEPVEIMRREHMNFLLHQRDATVYDGERGSRYSLSGCMDCHNPSNNAETAVRYPDPQHFCADCHRYASVRIDCFECHADRGLGELQQSRLTADQGLLSLQTFQRATEQPRVE